MREQGMANEATTASTASERLQAAQVYGIAVICLAAGLGIGYLLPSWPSATPQSGASVATGGGAQMSNPAAMNPMAVRQAHSAAGVTSSGAGNGRMPTIADLKVMSDKQVAPLLEKLKSDPNNSAVLAQIGAVYHTTHQFGDAAIWYGKALAIDPKNVSMRTRLASSLYRNGDADGAIAQLNKALTYAPGDANALFDLGLIRLQAKLDGNGALAAWQQLLKSNPQLSADRKAQVQKLMADVLTSMGTQSASKGAPSNDGHKSN